MAHNLTGEICKFDVLEHVDPGDPKVTDLDRVIEEDEEQQGSKATKTITTKTTTKSSSEVLVEESYTDRRSENFMPERRCSGSRIWDCSRDKDDVITVKYLPLKMSAADQPPVAESCNATATGSCTNTTFTAPTTSTTDAAKNDRTTLELIRTEDESISHEGGLHSEEPKVRIVEHIRKNLTLFESEREIYELSAPFYENRGHLQRLIVQKQPNKVPFNQRSVSDQYTQYRASDLTSYLQPSINYQSTSRYNPSNNYRSQRSRTTPSVDRIRRQKETTQRKRKTESLKRSVSSLNDFIRKPLNFVNRRGSKPHPVDKENTQIKVSQKESEEEHYKVPVKQHNYSSSQNLYLIPAPDYRVHIATRKVDDIISAHARAKQKLQKPQPDKGKLTQLFGTYSFRRTNQSNSRKSFNNPSDLVKAIVKMPSGKMEKATIVDNKDGTVKISYEPKEVGQHEIALRYNDGPIDESPVVFYVDAVGSAKKKITAYGPGLTHGLVGKACTFTINTGGLGSAKVNVTVDGPSTTQVTLNDNKDGTITASYLPLVSGRYEIKVSFDGKQMVGSPFSTLISDEGRQRSRINVSRGSEHTLDLKIAEEDLKTLTAVIVTPCGLEEPCGLKLLKNGQLAIVFTPREQGDHTVNVKRRGNHISGSPFGFDVLLRDIGDAKQVKVSGKNVKEGKTNVDNEITINTKDAGYGGLSVSLEGPGRSELSTKEVSDGSMKLFYKPSEPGHYSLLIKYADHVVPGSPFNIKISGQGTNPQKDSLKRYRKEVELADINTECHFSFKMPGVSAYDLSARTHSPHGNTDDASIVDKGDYVYEVKFVPKEVGLYSISIRNKDIHMPGSPFPFTVGPLLDFGPHKVRCGGPGLYRGSCGKLNEFNIFTREAGGGQLNVIIEGPSKPELFYTDRKDGSCHIGYKVAEPGEYNISVLFDDQEVPDSPFRAYIMPLTGDVSKIELGPMPPENMIQLNKPCNMTVIMNGARGNIEGKVFLPSGKQEDCFASPIDAENWGVRFIPRELGIHQVHIKYNKGSSHIPQSPILIRVGHDKADPASVLAHGHGLKNAVVNHATDFTIETCNAGHALLEVNIEGPSKVSMGCAEIDEGYKVDYTPLAPGDYLIAIKYNGCHIGSSPFKVRAVKQPGSRTVADAGSHEISSLSISTTDREAKQKVENMPKFKSDATRVYCKGMGLKKAFANKPNTLTVNCSEAGFNMLYAAFLGPTRNTIHECSIKHMGGSIYEIKYVCKDRGDAILVVKYGDEQIPGSPFRLECS